MADEADDFGGFEDDGDDYVPAEMAAADAHGAEEFADFGDDGFFDDDGGGGDGGGDDMDGFDDEDWGGDEGGGGDDMDGFDDEEEAGEGGAAAAPAADAGETAKVDEPHGLLAAAGAKPAEKKKETSQQRSRNGPRQKKGASANALSGSKMLASNLNKIISKISQPFVAGHDMSSNQTADVTDQAIVRLSLNCMMQFPGSFKVELRTESKGKGDLLAATGNISAQGSFGKVVVDFEDQPLLEKDKTYHLFIALERGGFKFQSVKDVKHVLPYVCYNRKEKKWVDDGKIAYVIKAVYEKPAAKRGTRSGYLKLKDCKSKKRMSMKKRDPFSKETSCFAVLSATTLSIFKDDALPQDVLKAFDVKTAKQITAKLGAGEMDAAAFTIEFEDATMFQFICASSADNTKWMKALNQAKDTVVRAFGMASNAGMMF